MGDPIIGGPRGMLKTIVIYMWTGALLPLPPRVCQDIYNPESGGAMHVIHGGNRVLNPVQYDPFFIFVDHQKSTSLIS